MLKFNQDVIVARNGINCRVKYLIRFVVYLDVIDSN